MKNKKDSKLKILIIALAVVLGVGIGTGTYAYFTAVANGNTNTITAGRLNNTIDNETIAIGSSGNNISLGNLQPGNVVNYSFEVTNGTSTLDQKYKITLVNNNSAASNDLTSAAIYDLTVIQGDTTETFSNLTYSEFVTKLASVKTLVYKAEVNKVRYEVVMNIPTSLDNQYQGAQGSFRLKVDATQTNDTIF